MNTKRPWLDDIVVGLTYYFATSLIVVLAVMFGREFIKPSPQRLTLPKDFLASFNQWDGLHYKSIAEGGYFYDPKRRSNVAFFPAYPLLGRLLVEATGMRTEAALLIISHTFLAGAFILLRTYVRTRFPDAGARMWDSTLLIFGVFPTTFFFRMTYTESMFVFLTILALLGMERRWPLVVIALICGLATATRPLGVALLGAFLLHLWFVRKSAMAFLVEVCVLLPIACWGLLAYGSFLRHAFGDALAFAQTQQHWADSTAESIPPRPISLLALEPITGVYDSSSARYWRATTDENPLFSIRFANPLYFVFTFAVCVIGYFRFRLSLLELVVSAALLLIPYVTKGYDYSMASHGRFAAIAFPAYLVLGRASVLVDIHATAAFCAGAIALLFAYTALFACAHSIF